MYDITHNSLFSNICIMAATITKNSSSMCSVCGDPTKYRCMSCQVSVCNICSIFEKDEDNPNWKAGKSVAYCIECKNRVGYNDSTQDESQDEDRDKDHHHHVQNDEYLLPLGLGQSTASANSTSKDFKRKIQKLKQTLCTASDR